MITLQKGDCLELLKSLADNSIDVIITSPPYNIGGMHSNQIKYGTYNGNDMEESAYQDWQIEVLNECYRVLKPSGYMFYNHKVRIRDGVAIHPLQWLLKTKFLLKQEIVWDMGKSANCDKIRFFPFSERIYWLAKDSSVNVDNNLHLSDVWYVVPTHKRNEYNHIAIMPQEIADKILESIPNVKDKTVLDPFMGTGTTIVSAISHNCNAIGFEIDSTYLDLAKERLGKTIRNSNEGLI